MATFSLFYATEGFESSAHAIDWSWIFKDRWARSEKEGLGWYVIEGLDQEAYHALIKKFGLEDYKEELPIEKVLAMNPLKLILIRREKERLFGLEIMQVVSDTVGNHIKADNFGKTERSVMT